MQFTGSLHSQLTVRRVAIEEEPNGHTRLTRLEMRREPRWPGLVRTTVGPMCIVSDGQKGTKASILSDDEKIGIHMFAVKEKA